MREEVVMSVSGEGHGSHPRALRFADQNQVPRCQNVRQTTHSLKLRSASSWGSQIVKNFDKKTKKLPLLLSDSSAQKNPSAAPPHPRVKRSLISDLSCSAGTVQTNPTHRRSSSSSGSRDILIELDQLRCLLQESKDRECKLQSELSECRRSLEREAASKSVEAEELTRKVESLECEKSNLSEQLAAVESTTLKRDDGGDLRVGSRNLEMEVVELRRLNKELQLQKRSLSYRLSSLESQLARLTKASEIDSVEKIKAEASMLRHTNEDLCKQVEGLQMSRLNEVEELAYLRWVNSCLRKELRNNGSSDLNSESESSPSSADTLSVKSYESSEYGSSARKVNLVKKLKKWPITDEEMSSLDVITDNELDKNWVCLDDERSPRRHSISGIQCSSSDEIKSSKRRQSDGFVLIEKGMESGPAQKLEWNVNGQEISKLVIPYEIEKRSLRIPNPPPRPTFYSLPSDSKKDSTAEITAHVPVPVPAPPHPHPHPPPPPPPPPPPMARPAAAKGTTPGKVKRAPQVVEFYHSLMKRDSRKDASSGVCDAVDVANVRSSMIGEIENRSSYLLAIKADVETQGEFVNSLIREVNDAVYQNIEDVVAFVKWLDDELCFLVDERAVLKHFEWPEKKADTFREAAFGYRDLKRLESEVCNYKDDRLLPCDLALKKIVALSEKMERTVYNLLRTRESLMRNCKEFHIPIDWMLDNGIISKIKFGSVKLAQKYMKRVALELQSMASLDKDPAMDYMLLQGVRFAFRIHQFAGGFDSETMQAFEELRNLACLLNKN
ncbi:hypothetical protein SAY86_011815 [Trapa natans]|uniref:Protein CHUP1, chloroplastic-like n=1 Tax=Trapa natans TaxID=22666 RepID=A0AAN7MBR5_TRANT|nr:hypothetical protein SAY86_011815 [Trapa natans]